MKLTSLLCELLPQGIPLSACLFPDIRWSFSFLLLPPSVGKHATLLFFLVGVLATPSEDNVSNKYWEYKCERITKIYLKKF